MRVQIVAADVMRVTNSANLKRIESLAHFNGDSIRGCLYAFRVSFSRRMDRAGYRLWRLMELSWLCREQALQPAIGS
jgi:hypothetical protein